MTIDERLERLAERHEALTQTVEMLTADVRTLAIASEAQRLSIELLADVAHSHQQRLDRLEGR